MKRAAIVVAFFAALAAPVLIGVLVFLPGQRSLVLDLYLLVIGAVALLALANAAHDVGEAEESAFEEALRHRAEPAEPLAQLASLERQVALGVGNAFDLHYRLRPLLAGVASHRLAVRGVSLEDEEEARGALGDEAWELVRPGRPPPADRFARGTSLRDLAAVLDSLERI